MGAGPPLPGAACRGRILVVEDDAEIRTGLAHQLERAGYRVFVATGVKDARLRLRTAVPDLVLLDLGLPDGSGLDLLDELRCDERGELVPVVVLTASDPAESKRPCLRGGAQVFLQKPLRGRELIDAIAKLIAPRGPGRLGPFDWRPSTDRGQGW